MKQIYGMKPGEWHYLTKDEYLEAVSPLELWLRRVLACVVWASVALLAAVAFSGCSYVRPQSPEVPARLPEGAKSERICFPADCTTDEKGVVTDLKSCQSIACVLGWKEPMKR